MTKLVSSVTLLLWPWACLSPPLREDSQWQPSLICLLLRLLFSLCVSGFSQSLLQTPFHSFLKLFCCCPFFFPFSHWWGPQMNNRESFEFQQLTSVFRSMNVTHNLKHLKTETWDSTWSPLLWTPDLFWFLIWRLGVLSHASETMIQQDNSSLGTQDYCFTLFLNFSFISYHNYTVYALFYKDKELYRAI